jgi:hypothetical protein
MIVTTEHPGTPADPAARERILLVEDNPVVRSRCLSGRVFELSNSVIASSRD